MVNDSTYNISLSSKDLFNYSKILKIIPGNITLHESGYRRWSDNCVEIFMDIGPIGPGHIPGHAHADTFNFEFLYKKRPIIVDIGISTYEKNSRRQTERSTEYQIQFVLMKKTLQKFGVDLELGEGKYFL